MPSVKQYRYGECIFQSQTKTQSHAFNRDKKNEAIDTTIHTLITNNNIVQA